MLTDEEAEEIRRKLDAGWRGPVLLRWLEERPSLVRESAPEHLV